MEVMNYPRPKSHVALWTTTLVVVPVIYLLSVPPMGDLIRRAHPKAKNPGWFELYRTPYQWVWEKTPLGLPLSRYSCWCWEQIVGQKLR